VAVITDQSIREIDRRVGVAGELDPLFDS